MNRMDRRPSISWISGAQKQPVMVSPWASTSPRSSRWTSSGPASSAKPIRVSAERSGMKACPPWLTLSRSGAVGGDLKVAGLAGVFVRVGRGIGPFISEGRGVVVALDSGPGRVGARGRGVDLAEVPLLEREVAGGAVAVVELDGAGQRLGVHLVALGDRHLVEGGVPGVLDPPETLEEGVGVLLRHGQLDPGGEVIDVRVLGHGGAGDRS